jgi:hypothetical protein
MLPHYASQSSLYFPLLARILGMLPGLQARSPISGALSLYTLSRLLCLLLFGLYARQR